MTSTTEQPEMAPSATTAAEAKPPKKARAGARARHVAPSKAKSGKKASPAKKAQKTPRWATSKPKAARAGKTAKAAKKKVVRQGSKTETILDLLKRPGGATAKQLLKATGWQAHSLRGFISGTLGKKMGLTVKSTKGEDGERSYSIKG